MQDLRQESVYVAVLESELKQQSLRICMSALPSFYRYNMTIRSITHCLIERPGAKKGGQKGNEH